MFTTKHHSSKLRSPSTKINNYKKPTANESLYRSIILVTVIFLIMLFIIGMLMGFHPPQPDSPILYRISSARHTHQHYSQHQHHDWYHHSEDTIFVAMPSVNDPGNHITIYIMH